MTKYCKIGQSYTRVVIKPRSSNRVDGLSRTHLHVPKLLSTEPMDMNSGGVFPPNAPGSMQCSAKRTIIEGRKLRGRKKTSSAVGQMFQEANERKSKVALLGSTHRCLYQGVDWRSRSSATICFRFLLLIVENPARHKVNTLELSPRNLVR